MTRGRKYSRVRMIQLTMQGLSQPQIAKELDCDQSTVSKSLQQLYLFKRGYPTGRSRDTHKRRKQITPDILRLYDEGHNMKEIIEALNSTYHLVKGVLHAHNLDTSQARGIGIIHARRFCNMADQLAEYLESHGPQHVRQLGLTNHFRRHLQQDERFELLKLRVGLGRWTKDPPRRLASGKCAVRINAIAASNDSRVPTFIAAQVRWTVDDQHEAASVMKRLRPRIGRNRAVDVIHLLGYRYKRQGKVVVEGVP